MVDPANAFAQYGCNEAGAQFFDWNTLYWIAAVLWLGYGGLVMASPFDVLPSDGIFKWGYLHVMAGFKEDGALEKEWTIMGSVSFFFAGTLMASLGAFFLWATESRDDYTFFTACIVGGALELVAWIYAYVRYRADWKPMIFTWIVTPLLTLILSIVVLSDHDKDLPQLKSEKLGGASDGVDVEVMLWILAAVHIFTAVQLLAMAFFEPFLNFQLKMHFKEDYEMSNSDRLGVRWVAAQASQVALIYTWAAYNFDESWDTDFTFPLVFWISMVMSLLVWNGTAVYHEGSTYAYHTSYTAIIFGGIGSAAVVGWNMSCN